MYEDLVKEGTKLYHEKLGTGLSFGLRQAPDRVYLKIKFRQDSEIKEFQYPSSLGAHIFFCKDDISTPRQALVNKEPYRRLNMTAQESALERFLSARKITKLIHFTRVSNLPSIMKNGLVPVSEHSRLGIQTVRNDSIRIDSKLSCTSLSVEFPNYRVLYSFRQRYPDVKWAILTLSSDLLFDKNKVKYYCQTNAARVLPHTNDDSALTHLAALENMFAEYVHSNGSRRARQDLNIPAPWTTDPQAEILIEGIIEPCYFRSVLFSSTVDLNSFQTSSTQTDLILDTCDVLFGPRNDYANWQGESEWQ